jgi:hypothetical protein
MLSKNSTFYSKIQPSNKNDFDSLSLLTQNCCTSVTSILVKLQYVLNYLLVYNNLRSMVQIFTKKLKYINYICR